MTTVSPIKAIETEYKGYRFRSRLEARWAVFFDAIGMEFQYEHQGYEKEIYEGKVYRYLPDFYLPSLKMHAEVKGDPHWNEKEGHDFGWFLDYDCPLPHFTDSKYEHPGGLILLGEVPHIQFGVVCHPIIRHYKGLHRDFISFDGGNRIRQEDAVWLMRFDDLNDFVFSGTWDGTTGDCLEYFDQRPMAIETKRAHRDVVEAYIKARQARFEFGETRAAR